ncbi:hypothetical protein DFJ74DRAFT_758702 [Hyaloraphidium curvatum]|nr:hypothetical protein DFJ74DRAFT_758702 [Hyaloraphidium curvatum]
MSPREVAPEATALSPEEWLVLFPAGMSPSPSRPVAEPPPDPAAARRAEDPLTLAAAREAFASAGLRWTARLVRFHERLPWVRSFTWFFYLVALGIAPALAWTGLHATESPYASQATVAGLAVALLVAWESMVCLCWDYLAKNGLRRPKPFRPYDKLALASAVRWLQLRSDVSGKAGESSETPVSVLLLHDDADAMCSCPRGQCGGGQLRRDAYIRFFDFWADVLRTAVVTLLLLWTPMVSLAGKGFWHSWGVTGAIFALIWTTLFYPLMVSVREYTVHTEASANIVRRNLHRALSASLRSFLRRYREFLSKYLGENPATASSVELHARILALLEYAWASQLGYLPLYRRLLVTCIIANLVAFIVNLAVGPCITAFQIADVAGIIFVVARELLITAAYNSQVEDVASLCASAAAAARSLLTEHAGGSPDPQAFAALRAHEHLLAGAAASALERRVRFLGQPIGFGTARGLAITGITIIFAAVGAMRGFGVRVVLGTVCTPGQ